MSKPCNYVYQKFKQRTEPNQKYSLWYYGPYHFSNFIIFYYALIDQKYSYSISFTMLSIIRIINYVAYKNGLINRRSTISAIIIVAIIVAIILLNR